MIYSEVLLHTTAPCERWDTLALLYYGDPLRYRPLLEANPELGNPTILPEGIVVKVPILDEQAPTTTADLPPWRA